jgi:EmrB/QacA subfamily drug resistance transporter
MRAYRVWAGGLLALTHRQRMVLLAAVAATALMFSGMTSIAVALPGMQGEFDVPRSVVHWVIAGALLPVASLVTVSGRFGDLFGRRKLFLAGVACFGLGSAVSGLAPTASVLIVGRVLQGIGAGLGVPLALANLTETLPEARRGWGIGVLATGTTVVTSAAPLLMAVLVQVASWRWLFLANVPIAAAVLALAMRYVSETRGPDGQSLDLRGVLLLSTGLSLLVIGSERAGRSGLTDVATMTLVSIGLLVLAAFVVAETRARDPVLDPRLLTRPLVWGPMVGLATMQCASLGVTVFMMLYLQQVLDLAPLLAGLLLLATGLGSPFLSPLAGRLTDRGMGRWLIAGGLVLAAATLIWLTWGIGRYQGVWLVPAFAVFSVAPALVNTPGSAGTIAGIPERARGVAAGLTVEARQIGGAVGLALLGSVMIAVEWETRERMLLGPYADFSPDQQRALDSLLFDGDRSILFHSVPPEFHARTMDAANEAFVTGLQAAMSFAGVLLALAASLIFIALAILPRAGRR